MGEIVHNSDPIDFPPFLLAPGDAFEAQQPSPNLVRSQFSKARGTHRHSRISNVKFAHHGNLVAFSIYHEAASPWEILNICNPEIT